MFSENQLTICDVIFIYFCIMFMAGLTILIMEDLSKEPSNILCGNMYIRSLYLEELCKSHYLLWYNVYNWFTDDFLFFFKIKDGNT